MPKTFDGKVVLVTGGSSGIGRATAVAFAREGARIVVASRRPDESEETIRLVKAEGSVGLFVATDMKKPKDIQAMVARTIEHFGQLDHAFNNAGIEGDLFVPTADYPETTWNDVISVNLTSVFLSMKSEIPHLLATRGSIVNMASVAGLAGGKLGSAYYASKHGVVGLTKASAMEYADKGIRINAVAPAVIMTPMAQRGLVKDESLTKQVVASHPMGRIGTPEEVAAAVLWLCSAGASFTTGHVLPVDGGRLIP
jgi:NAD(P)-dependent dehydrogenase (short-subunit alcohol dehydrogenase family)